MQQTRSETISLAAYIPWSAIPVSVQDEIEAEMRCGFLNRRNFDKDFDDSNTKIYFIREKDDICSYTVYVDVYWSEAELPESQIINLVDLTDQECNYIDMLIQDRVIYALRHIDDLD